MDFRFKTKDLELLFTEGENANKYPAEVFEAFVDAVGEIAQAETERDFYYLKGFHYEKLKGKRADQRSMRLNRQWRLILTIEIAENGRQALIINLENHYAR